jgi:hypothetical protein
VSSPQPPFFRHAESDPADGGEEPRDNHLVAPVIADAARCGSSGSVIGRTPFTERIANFGSRFCNSAKKPGKWAAP